MDYFKLRETGERISEKSDFNSFIEQFRTYIFNSEKINELIKNKYSKKITIVDCACGTGYGIKYLASSVQAKNIDFYGIDNSLKAINYCR